jgi:hypothetical protein
MFAYLDPGTGSLVLQMSIAGLLGGIFVVKNFLGQLKKKVLDRS